MPILGQAPSGRCERTCHGDDGSGVLSLGDIPTGALIYYGMSHDRASIMITGSRIPDDRNDIKFNMPWGEILKENEVEISARYKEIKEKLTALKVARLEYK